MRVAGLTVKDRGQVLVKKDIRVGADGLSWTYLDGPLGIHCPQENVRGAEVVSPRISAGVFDGEATGGLRFDEIVIDFGSPVAIGSGMTLVEALGSAIRFGGDGSRHCIPPRGSLSARVVIGGEASAAVSGRRKVKNSVNYAPGLDFEIPALALSSPVKVVQGQIGLRRWSGPLDSGDTGGGEIDILPGANQDPVWNFARVDGYRNRSNLDCFRAETGTPPILLDRKLYGMWRVWNYTGVLEEFCAPSGQWQYDRLPKWWNDGPCAYENEACGLDHYSSPVAMNLEHRWRWRETILVAVDQYGDRLSAIDQLVDAYDCAYSIAPMIEALEAQAAAHPGGGHKILGKRELCWAAESMNGGDSWTRDLARRLMSATNLAMMPSGFVIRRGPGDDTGSPGMFVKSEPIPDPLDLDMEGSQLMEEIIRCFVSARLGQLRPALLTLDRLFRSGSFGLDRCVLDQFGYLPKFLATAQRGKVFRRVNRKAGKPDLFPWWAAALGAVLARDPEPFYAGMRRLPDPNGRVGVTNTGTFSNLMGAYQKEQTGLAAALLSSRL